MAAGAASFWVSEMGGLVTVLKAILALALVGGTTTAIVAPAFDMASARNAASAASAARAPLANNTPPPNTTPDPERTYPPQVDYDVLLRACLDSRDPDTEACMNAQSESGLSPEAFRAQIVAKLAPEKAEPAKDRPPFDALRQSDFATYFGMCLATRNFDRDECLRAEQLSGLGTAEFEAKFKAKLAANDGGDFWTWFDKCLATRDVHSDPCVRAQALIGFSDADFQAKFARYLAERDAASHKPSPTPKPTPTAKPTPMPAPAVWTAYVELLVKDCLAKNAAATAMPGSTQAVAAAGEACQKGDHGDRTRATGLLGSVRRLSASQELVSVQLLFVPTPARSGTFGSASAVAPSGAYADGSDHPGRGSLPKAP